METVYYEGSDTHQYLARHSLIDEGETQINSSFNSLADLLPKQQQPATSFPLPKQNIHKLCTVQVDLSKVSHLLHFNMFHYSFACSWFLLLICFMPYSLSYLQIGCMIIVWAIALRLLIPVRVIKTGTNESTSFSYSKKTIQLLQGLRKLAIDISVGKFGQQQIQIIYINITKICTYFIPNIPNAYKTTCITPTIIHNTINQIIDSINQKIINTYYDSNQSKISQICFKICTCIILQFRLLLIYDKLSKYHHHLKQISQSNNGQSNLNGQQRNLFSESFLFHQQLLQISTLYLLQQQLGNKDQSKWLRSVNKTIFNLLKMQLMQNDRSQIMSQEHYCNENKQQVDLNIEQTDQITSAHIVTHQLGYLQITIDGEKRNIEDASIKDQIQNLKDKLDQILEEKMNANSDQESKEQENKIMMTQQTKFERRVEGFGNILANMRSEKMSQFYLD